jgi:hypothetical protein
MPAFVGVGDEPLHEVGGHGQPALLVVLLDESHGMGRGSEVVSGQPDDPAPAARGLTEQLAHEIVECRVT